MERRQFLRNSLGASASYYLPRTLVNLRHEILAFYYGWYGDDADHATWRDVDAANFRIGNTAHYPQGGPYSSADPAVIERHMEQMQTAGITGLIYSWWGRDCYEDKHFQLVIDKARDHGLRVSVYYEICPFTNKVPDPVKVAADIEYLIDRYSNAENWLKRGDKRVFFIYAYSFNQLGRAAWKLILLASKQKHRDTVMFSVDAQTSDGLDFVDSIHRYALVASSGPKTPEQLLPWARQFYPSFLKQQRGYELTTLTVFPGYDDTHLKRSNAVNTQRYDGEFYSTLWRETLKLSPDWILIASWNEWHEGSEIEPSREFGDLYLKLTRSFALRVPHPF